MKTLSSIWFAKKFDYEYNQYILLDYLQRAENEFKNFNISNYLFDVRWHSKNLECFLTTRTFMETKDRPVKDANAQRFKKLMKLPDDDDRVKGIYEIVKWSIPKLQECLKKGTQAWKKIESGMHVFYVGSNSLPDRNEGYVLLRQAGSVIVEVHKFVCKPKTKEIEFALAEYIDAPGKMDYGDVRQIILKKTNELDGMFIGIDCDLAFGSKSILMVAKHILSTKIFSKNIIGLLGSGENF